MRTVVSTLLATLAFATVAGALLVYSGVYNVAATQQHYRPIYWLLATMSSRSIAYHARDIEVPPLRGAALRDNGLMLYDEHCVRCHGAPGIAPAAFSLGLIPLPPNLADEARGARPEDLYWAIRHGVKATGMPAWEFRLDDEDLWALTAFVYVDLPDLTPGDYAARVGDTDAVPRRSIVSGQPRVGRPERGKVALHQFGCATCHEIPGIVAGHPDVGPPLAHVRGRSVIAGVLPNSPRSLAAWIESPQHVSPGSAMPDLGVDGQTAYDMSAYLYSLD